MDFVNFKYFFPLAVVAGFLVLFGCIGQAPSVQPENQKIIVGVTIAPQAEFVEAIGGDRVEVILMVPPGASPHTYEPTPQQLEKISDAVMYAKVGSGVEFELSWMGNLEDLNRGMKIVDCSKGIELISSDPHIWTSPKNAKIMVENIYAGLIEVDPMGQGYYEQNKINYLKKLDKVDQNIVDSVKGKQCPKFIAYHPAWGYFPRDYGLEQIAIEGEGKNPTPKGISSVITQAKENNITVIFASPQFSTSDAQTIAQEIGGKVLLIDPLAKDYIQNLEEVASALKENIR